jgi:glycosyltransferase involved in cell wall biosynthesis
VLLGAIKAMPPELRERVVVVFVGDGPLRDEVARQAQEPPQVATRFVGFQNQRALSPYYHAADLLVLPSRYESWGLVVNEALHHGLPCVVSDQVGCAPDLVEPGRTGEVFPAGDVEALRQALGRAVAYLGRDEVRACCRARVEGYSVRTAAAGLARAFGEVCGMPLYRA